MRLLYPTGKAPYVRPVTFERPALTHDVHEIKQLGDEAVFVEARSKAEIFERNTSTCCHWSELWLTVGMS